METTATYVKCAGQKEAQKVIRISQKIGLNTRKRGLDVFIWEDGKTYMSGDFYGRFRAYGAIYQQRDNSTTYQH